MKPFSYILHLFKTLNKKVQMKPFSYIWARNLERVKKKRTDETVLLHLSGKQDT